MTRPGTMVDLECRKWNLSDWIIGKWYVERHRARSPPSTQHVCAFWQCKVSYWQSPCYREKRKCVSCIRVSPGLSTTSGKLGWLIASGHIWVSKHSPAAGP